MNFKLWILKITNLKLKRYENFVKNGNLNTRFFPYKSLLLPRRPPYRRSIRWGEESPDTTEKHSG